MSLSVTAQPVPLWTDSDGVIRVGGSRVTLDTLIGAFRDGASAEAIADQYPSLSLADIYAVIGFYLHHQAEVDAHLEQHHQEAARVREANEKRFDPSGIRERLQNRRPRQE